MIRFVRSLGPFGIAMLALVVLAVRPELPSGPTLPGGLPSSGVDTGQVLGRVQSLVGELRAVGGPLAPGGPMAPVSAGQRAARFARAQLGDRYLFGARGPDRWDCSGLTGASWEAAGVTLPRTAAEQYSATTRLRRTSLRTGDLLFFDSRGPTGWHVAIVSRPGHMIEASGRGIPVREVRIRRGAVGYGRPIIGGR